MKTDFSQPRFTGARFEEHTLPVDVARDLNAYEALIIALAKHLYLKEHPDRQRVPKGFASSFRLDIARIDEGSTKPLLTLVTAGTLALTGGERDYFEQARDLIAECVAAPEGALPDDFPKDCLVHFNQFGRSLRDDEAVELPLPDGRMAARLTPDRRKRLVLASEQFYEREFSLSGYIEEVDYSRPSFRLRLPDGGQLTVPMLDFFRNEVRTYGGHSRHLVSVSGVGTYDSWDRFQGIVSVESLEVLKNHALSSRFEEILQIQPGWYEGSGSAVSTDQLIFVSEKLIDEYPDNLQLPQIVLKQDGNLLLEWKAEGDPSLDVDLNASQASFHAFGKDGADVERDFKLDPDGWRALFVWLLEHIKPLQA